MTSTPVVPAPNRGSAVLPALVAAIFSVLLLLGGTLYAEYEADHDRLVGDDGIWNVWVVQLLHPFGLTGWMVEQDDAAGLADSYFNFSVWPLLLGTLVLGVVVFCLILLALRSLEPGRPVVAALFSSWFAAVGGGAAGGLAVGLVKAFSIDDEAKDFGVTASQVLRVWLLNGAVWGVMFGVLVAALALVVWLVRGSGTPSTIPTPTVDDSDTRRDRFGIDADRGDDDSSYPSSR